MDYFRFERTRRFIGSPLRYCLILAFLIAAILVGGSVAEASEKKPPQDESLDLTRKWIGDFDGMLKDRVIRVLVAYSKTFYFLDQGRQNGMAGCYGRLELMMHNIESYMFPDSYT